MTSKCTMSAPAASTLRTSSPRRAKSAERMEGAIQGACRPGCCVMSAALARSLDAAMALDGLVRLEDALRALVRRSHHRFRQALRDELVRMILAHQPAKRAGDFRIGRGGGHPEHLVCVRQARRGAALRGCARTCSGAIAAGAGPHA